VKIPPKAVYEYYLRRYLRQGTVINMWDPLVQPGYDVTPYMESGIMALTKGYGGLDGVTTV
jgi:hypothetical protein